MALKKIKLGILLDSYYTPAWIYHSIERIINSDYAEIPLLILNENTNTLNHNREDWNKKTPLIYKIFNAIDEKIFVRGKSATKFKSVEELLNLADILKIKPIQDKTGNYIEPGEIEKIREYGLDILIKVGFENLRGNILTASKYGVWGYFCERDPHGFWEVLEGLPETRMQLRIITGETNSGKTIYSSSSSTYPFSPARNRNRSLWKSSSFLPRQIEFLQTQGEEKFFAETEKIAENNLSPIQNGLATDTSSLMQGWLIIKLLIKNMGEMFNRKIKLDAWFLMFDLDQNETVPFCNYRKIVPPKDRFWADPHVIQKENNYHVFIEEFDSKKSKGHISVLTVDQSGNYTLPVRVLEKEYHLSYPCVFKWEDRYFMVPESSANGTIDLYECIEFPNKWKHKLSLMENITAVDTTMLFYHGKWWLFTGISENEGSSPEVELFLFFSDDLFTKNWTAHPLNPIKTDVKNARPAGRIFTKDGKLFRPSQDCSKSYGYGFDLNEILVLSETEYSEKRIATVRPDWDKQIFATHTYGIEGKFKIIDAYTTRTRFMRN